MSPPRLSAGSPVSSPLRLTAAYAVFGTLWILVSDEFMFRWFDAGMRLWRFESAKGLFFIGITSLLLYVLTRRLLQRHISAAQALRTSEERLTLALESASQGIHDLDIPTGALVVNDGYATMLGHDPVGFTETRGTWNERVHPEDRPRINQKLEDFLAGRRPDYRAEFRLRTKQGNWIWILAHGRIVERDAADRPLRMIGTLMDITRRKSAEEQASDALAFARAVYRSSPVGIITYGPEGNATTANEAAARMSGTDVPGLLRQNYRQLESWRKYGLLALAEQAVATGKEIAHRGPLLTSFGRDLWIKAWFVPFSFGGENHLLLMIEDETERHRKTEDLNLLHSAVQASPSGWVITNAEGVIEFVNPGFTAMTGYSAAEAVGRKPSMLKSGRHHVAFYAKMWATIRRGEVWHGELENCRKDGTFYQ